MEGFNVPILFIIFNRVDTTQRVFEEIRKQKPKYLFVAADGPRKNRQDDIENCEKTREIISRIDWGCQVKTLFRNENLGCGKAVSGAISWFFGNVDMGIILEDDCLPHSDFFPYCEELLLKYKDEEKIKVISGDNFQKGRKRGEQSYYFSAYPHIWGWASWKRTWKEYDYSLDSISKKEFRSILKDYFSNSFEREFWYDKFILSKKHYYNTWDYQLSFCIWKNRGLNIIPNVNLITNIGFGNNSTHTNNPNSVYSNIPTNRILPLSFSNSIKRNNDADYFYFKNYNYKSPIRLLYRFFQRNFFNFQRKI